MNEYKHTIQNNPWLPKINASVTEKQYGKSKDFSSVWVRFIESLSFFENLTLKK